MEVYGVGWYWRRGLWCSVGLLIGVPIKLYSETYKTKSEMLHDMRYYSLYPGILAVVCCWAITMMSYGSGVASNRLVARIRVVAFGAVFRHEVGWFDFTENSSGALVSRLTSDPAVLHSMTSEILAVLWLSWQRQSLSLHSR
ncbi:hypothetical protein PC129_g19455 [Phytophthora cactorum]|uniref:ABC transmembrane type-1 domain-containing protein n=1 Tax=Phytophthora cactorum TaxID=29920 RepID=A0A329RBN7_9STRA|nr:hypothetical protein PC111_g19831 [Phytophthora cactorum]KAG2809157.1 hypothetical protein PC112_g16633 [Phytophthora cactorum]KAG2849515.1 hypothetical protein PC113_g17397 [Phytophthora cactorum]KAG2879517.1 hypothetical protein PC114_g22537 [Phytophthora cactorum]KAG2888230.1 hypothetical protein PC115_g20132 [Phytophthora cactorum]